MRHLNRGIRRKIPHVEGGRNGKGVNSVSIKRQMPFTSESHGVNSVSIKRQMPFTSEGRVGQGVNRTTTDLSLWLTQLAKRLRRVRVVCGDWTRIMGNTVLRTKKSGFTGIFLDPPYDTEYDKEVYHSQGHNISGEVLKWCIDNGSNPKLKIALCGYLGEHDILETLGWKVVAWKANGGYSNRNKENINKTKERIWFSPACNKTTLIN